MTNTAEAAEARALADRLFEGGSPPEELRAALASLGDGRAEFLSRLAARGAISDAEGSDGSKEPAPASLLQAFQRAYDDEKARSAGLAEPKDLSRAAPWMAAAGAFGGDISFVMKLAGRHLTPPTPTFLRYAADVLGVALAQVTQHFAAGGMAPGIVGAEHKAPGKPGPGRVEDFAAAVRAADLPDALRARWLKE